MGRQADAYVELCVEAPPHLVEAIEWIMLEAGALGTSSAVIGGRHGEATGADSPSPPSEAGTQTPPSGAEPHLVTGYFLPQHAPALSAIAAQLEQVGWSRALGRLSSRTERWRDWAAESRQHFKAVRLTSQVLLAPPWDIPAERDAAVLIVEPGAAFGIGTHGTTRGCMELIEAWHGEDSPVDGRTRAAGPAPRAWSMLDVGTGTGILAMRAHQLGARPVVALDNDPDAIETAVRNLAHNAMGGIGCFTGTLAALRAEKSFDLVTANILRDPLLAMAAALAGQTRARGGLILSGFHEEDAATVVAAYRPLGYTIADHRCFDGWSSLLLEPLGPGRIKERQRP